MTLPTYPTECFVPFFILLPPFRNGVIIYVVTDSEFECAYLAKNGNAVSGDIMKYLHVAARKEIQEAGLWNMVINKDNYSSEQDEIETKLDEYQKLGEEIFKNEK